MRRPWARALAFAACCGALACGGAAIPADLAALQVESVEPRAHSRELAPDGRIGVRFDRPVRAASLTPRSFWAFGRWSGTVEGEYRVSDDGRTVQLLPRRRLSAGEQVTVLLSGEIQAADGQPLRRAGYSFQFWTRAAAAPMAFETVQVLSTRSQPLEPSRAYGGLASDLNGDGFSDLTVVNEDSADVRVFLNRADGSGRFHDFLRPTTAVGQRASPSEAADFDRDGRVDVCVANIDANTVSILLGDGDGRFGRTQHVRDVIRHSRQPFQRVHRFEVPSESRIVLERLSRDLHGADRDHDPGMQQRAAYQRLRALRRNALAGAVPHAQ